MGSTWGWDKTGVKPKYIKMCVFFHANENVKNT